VNKCITASDAPTTLCSTSKATSSIAKDARISWKDLLFQVFWMHLTRSRMSLQRSFHNSSGSLSLQPNLRENCGTTPRFATQVGYSAMHVSRMSVSYSRTHSRNHSICDPCASAFNSHKCHGEQSIVIPQCPLGCEWPSLSNWTIRRKPSEAGVRILSLDG
jgi:hypothetical protein